MINIGIIASSIYKAPSGIPFLVSATIENAAPTDIVMVFSEIVTGTNLGFTISGTTSTTFASISGSGTTTITGVMAAAATSTETVLLSYDDTVGDLVDVDTNPVATFSNEAVINNVVTVLSDALGAYALHDVFDVWTHRALRIRRSSDNATTNVFFDGSGEISLSSLTGALDVPSTPTLGTWIGSDDGFINQWYFQTPSNTELTPNLLAQNTAADQPKIITAGAIDTYNTKTTAFFDGGDSLNSSIAHSELATGNNFTVLSVSANTVTNGVGGVWCNTNTASDRLVVFNDRRTNKLNFKLVNSGATNYDCINLLQDNTSSQKMQTAISDSSLNISAYKDGALQSTNTYTGTYTNDYFRVGSQFSAQTKLTGHIQEILIFDSDKTSEISALQTDRNNYYSIY